MQDLIFYSTLAIQYAGFFLLLLRWSNQFSLSTTRGQSGISNGGDLHPCFRSWGASRSMMNIYGSLVDFIQLWRFWLSVEARLPGCWVLIWNFNFVMWCSTSRPTSVQYSWHCTHRTHLFIPLANQVAASSSKKKSAITLRQSEVEIITLWWICVICSSLFSNVSHHSYCRLVCVHVFVPLRASIFRAEQALNLLT